MTRFSAIGVCLVGLIASGLVACGDNEDSTPDATGGTGGKGGSTAKGGATAKGGSTAEGGSTAKGGSSTSDGGTSAVTSCTASFVSPKDGTALSDADDVDGDYCQNGFSHNIEVATSAPEGTTASLQVDGTEIATTTVTGAKAQFDGAELGNQGTKVLKVVVGSGESSCNTEESTITIDCLGIPTCTVSAPTFKPALRTALNGVAVASGGDRVSSAGSPYQTQFSVATTIENGQPVALTVDGAGIVYGVAADGVANFPGVTLTPDGAHQVTATCTARSGAAGVATALGVTVDTVAPDLAVTKGTGTGAATLSALATGDHFGPTDDADTTLAGLQMKVCGTTAAADASNLPSTLGANQNNFCAAIGGNAPVCSPVTAAKTGCVNVTCPGTGPFDLALTLKDGAQNPTAVSRTNLTCAATNPTVTFLDPVANDATFSDKSKRILAAGNTEATRVDQGTASGAQYVVRACTSAPVGSTAVLKTGRLGETLADAGSVTTITSTDANCTGSLIVFPSVTLPETLSTNAADAVPTAPTQVAVTVTDLNLGTTTQTIDVWVDSENPTLTINSPLGLCGKYFYNPTDITQTIVFGTTVASTDFPVKLTVTNPDATQALLDCNTLAFSQCTLSDVPLKVGQSTLAVRVTEPSGNYRGIAGCTVDVGQNPPPTVTWQAPLSTSVLTAPGNGTTGAIVDGNTSTAGWQGTLTVCTDLDSNSRTGVTVQFTANGTNIGDPVAVSSSTGCATLTNATVPEGAAVALKATTSAGANGSGSATITVPVDVTVPAVPESFQAAVKNRRETSFALTWNVPADGVVPPKGYEVKFSSSAITAGNFDAATDVAYSGTPGTIGSPDGVDVLGKLIEKSYYFAARAVDSVGNKGPIAATTTATKASFIVQTLTPPTAGNKELFGWVVDGGSDFNGDGNSDLLVSTQLGQSVYIYFGSASGLATTPSITFVGSPGYGYSAAGIGDVNGDGVDDLAIGNQLTGNGSLDVFYGDAAWTAGTTVNSVNADVKMQTDAGADAGYDFAAFSYAIARLGDVDGDSIDDFAVSTPFYNVFEESPGVYRAQGQVAIVHGVSHMTGGIAPTITLPGAFGSGVVRIDGNLAAGGSFGQEMIGLGRFYSGNPNNVLVVAAPYSRVGADANAGELFAYAGSGSATAASYVSGTVADPNGLSGLGMNGLGVMGNLGPNGQPSLGVFLPFHPSSPGRVQLFSGASTGGLFDSFQWLASAESSVNPRFGRLVVGGAIRGTNTTVSYIGTDKSDIIVATRAGGNSRLFIIDGTALTVANGTTNADTLAQVELATGFAEYGFLSTPAKDIDSDTYADFAVGETSYDSTAPIDGRVLVYR